MTITTNTEKLSLDKGTVNRDNFLLRYKIEGKGLPAMVIGSVNQYRQTFSDDLREHLQLIFIDHRAFVAAPEGLENAQFGLNVILEDIEAIRQELHLDKVIVIGHSGHSYMAFEYAKKYPQHVSHLVMIAISPSLSLEHQKKASFYWQDFASEERKVAHATHLQQSPDEAMIHLSPGERFVREYIRNSAKIWYNFEMDASPLWDDVTVNMTIFSHLWSGIFREIDLTHGISDFNVPIFLALGLHDFAIAPFTAWYPIREHFKQLTISLFEKSGHFPQMEEAALFNERMLNWVKMNNGSLY